MLPTGGKPPVTPPFPPAHRQALPTGGKPPVTPLLPTGDGPVGSCAYSLSAARVDSSACASASGSASTPARVRSPRSQL